MRGMANRTVRGHRTFIELHMHLYTLQICLLIRLLTMVLNCISLLAPGHAILTALHSSLWVAPKAGDLRYSQHYYSSKIGGMWDPARTRFRG
jgi:hypothetical protein